MAESETPIDEQLPSEHPASPDEPTPPAGEHFQQRYQRIHDHLEASLKNPKPLISTLGCVNSDLMVCELQIATALRQLMADRPLSMEAIESQASAIAQLSRLAKQIAQVSKLELRSSPQDSRESPPPPSA